MKALLSASRQIVQAKWPGHFALTLEQKQLLCTAATRLHVACLAADRAEDQCPYQHGLPPPEPLTKREAEVLWCHSRGLTKCEIATRLGISCDTVIAHLKNIYKKIDAHTGEAAARWFMVRLGHVLGVGFSVLPEWVAVVEGFLLPLLG